MAVASELLFHGFNASLPTVDTGVDIVALKNGRTYLIQVKTKHWNKRRSFPVVLEIEALKRYTDSKTFVVVVVRDREMETNEFIVLPIHILTDVAKQLRVRKNQRGKPSVRFTFRKLKKKDQISLNRYGSVSQFRNAWNLIE